MNIQDIVKNYLVENGFDGLSVDGCGCGIDDLFPCGEPMLDCSPSYRVECDKHCSDWARCFAIERTTRCVEDDELGGE